MDDRAEGVFQGRIVVRPDAQKTDGRMMTQGLLLSEDASFFVKPELEIFADDVQCAHGATSGEIDEDILFYLLSRGIPRPEAETLLVTAFLAEAIEGLGDEAIGDAFEVVSRNWLAARGQEAA
jgi:Fe-S cluster assembly protein SufD